MHSWASQSQKGSWSSKRSSASQQAAQVHSGASGNNLLTGVKQGGFSAGHARSSPLFTSHQTIQLPHLPAQPFYSQAASQNRNTSNPSQQVHSSTHNTLLLHHPQHPPSAYPSARSQSAIRPPVHCSQALLNAQLAPSCRMSVPPQYSSQFHQLNPPTTTQMYPSQSVNPQQQRTARSLQRNLSQVAPQNLLLQPQPYLLQQSTQRQQQQQQQKPPSAQNLQPTQQQRLPLTNAKKVHPEQQQLFSDCQVSFAFTSNNCKCRQLYVQQKNSSPRECPSLRVVYHGSTKKTPPTTVNQNQQHPKRALCLDCAYRRISVPDGYIQATTSEDSNTDVGNTETLCVVQTKELVLFAHKHVLKKVLPDLSLAIRLGEKLASEGYYSHKTHCKEAIFDSEEELSSDSERDNNITENDSQQEVDVEDTFSDSSSESYVNNELEETDEQYSLHNRTVTAILPFFIDVGKQIGIWLHALLWLQNRLSIENNRDECDAERFRREQKSTTTMNQMELEQSVEMLLSKIKSLLKALQGYLDRLFLMLGGLVIKYVLPPVATATDMGLKDILLGGVLSGGSGADAADSCQNVYSSFLLIFASNLVNRWIILFEKVYLYDPTQAINSSSCKPATTLLCFQLTKKPSKTVTQRADKKQKAFVHYNSFLATCDDLCSALLQSAFASVAIASTASNTRNNKSSVRHNGIDSPTQKSSLCASILSLCFSLICRSVATCVVSKISNSTGSLNTFWSNFALLLCDNERAKSSQRSRLDAKTISNEPHKVLSGHNSFTRHKLFLEGLKDEKFVSRYTTDMNIAAGDDTDEHQRRDGDLLCDPISASKREFGLFSPQAAFEGLNLLLTNVIPPKDQTKGSCGEMVKRSTHMDTALLNGIACFSTSSATSIRQYSYRLCKFISSSASESSSPSIHIEDIQQISTKTINTFIFIGYKSLNQGSPPPIVPFLQCVMTSTLLNNKPNESKGLRQRTQRPHHSLPMQKLLDGLVDTFALVAPFGSSFFALQDADLIRNWRTIMNTYVIPFLSTFYSRCHMHSNKKKFSATIFPSIFRLLRLHFVSMRIYLRINWSKMYLAAHQDEDEEELAGSSHSEDSSDNEGHFVESNIENKVSKNTVALLRECAADMSSHVELSQACLAELCESLNDSSGQTELQRRSGTQSGPVGRSSALSLCFEIAAAIADIAILAPLPSTIQQARGMVKYSAAYCESRICEDDNAIRTLDDYFLCDEEVKMQPIWGLSLLSELTPWNVDGFEVNHFTLVLQPAPFLKFILELPSSASALLYEFFYGEGIIKACLHVLSPHPSKSSSNENDNRFLGVSQLVDNLKVLYEQPKNGAMMLLSNSNYLYEEPTPMQQPEILTTTSLSVFSLITTSFLLLVRGSSTIGVLNFYRSNDGRDGDSSQIPAGEVLDNSETSIGNEFASTLIFQRFIASVNEMLNAHYPFPITLPILIESLSELAHSCFPSTDGSQQVPNHQHADTVLLMLSILTTCKPFLFVRGTGENSEGEHHSSSCQLAVPGHCIHTYVSLVALCCWITPAAGHELQLWCIQMLINLYEKVELCCPKVIELQQQLATNKMAEERINNNGGPNVESTEHAIHAQRNLSVSGQQLPSSSQLSDDIGLLLHQHLQGGHPFDWNLLLLVVFRNLTHNPSTVTAAVQILWVALKSTTSISTHDKSVSSLLIDQNERKLGSHFTENHHNKSTSADAVSNPANHHLSPLVGDVIAQLIEGGHSMTDVLKKAITVSFPNANDEDHDRKLIVLLVCCSLLEKCVPASSVDSELLPNAPFEVSLMKSDYLALFEGFFSGGGSTADTIGQSESISQRLFFPFLSYLSYFAAREHPVMAQEGLPDKWFGFDMFQLKRSNDMIFHERSTIVFEERFVEIYVGESCTERRNSGSKNVSKTRPEVDSKVPTATLNAHTKPSQQQCWQPKKASQSQVFVPFAGSKTTNSHHEKAQGSLKDNDQKSTRQYACGFFITVTSPQEVVSTSTNHISILDRKICPVVAAVLSWLLSNDNNNNNNSCLTECFTPMRFSLNFHQSRVSQRFLVQVAHMTSALRICEPKTVHEKDNSPVLSPLVAAELAPIRVIADLLLMSLLSQDTDLSTTFIISSLRKFLQVASSTPTNGSNGADYPAEKVDVIIGQKRDRSEEAKSGNRDSCVSPSNLSVSLSVVCALLQNLLDLSNENNKETSRTDNVHETHSFWNPVLLHNASSQGDAANIYSGGVSQAMNFIRYPSKIATVFSHDKTLYILHEVLLYLHQHVHHHHDDDHKECMDENNTGKSFSAMPQSTLFYETFQDNVNNNGTEHKIMTSKGKQRKQPKPSAITVEVKNDRNSEPLGNAYKILEWTWKEKQKDHALDTFLSVKCCGAIIANAKDTLTATCTMFTPNHTIAPHSQKRKPDSKHGTSYGVEVTNTAETGPNQALQLKVLATALRMANLNFQGQHSDSNPASVQNEERKATFTAISPSHILSLVDTLTMIAKNTSSSSVQRRRRSAINNQQSVDKRNLFLEHLVWVLFHLARLLVAVSKQPTFTSFPSQYVLDSIQSLVLSQIESQNRTNCNANSLTAPQLAFSALYDTYSIGISNTENNKSRFSTDFWTSASKFLFALGDQSYKQRCIFVLSLLNEFPALMKQIPTDQHFTVIKGENHDAGYAVRVAVLAGISGDLNLYEKEEGNQNQEANDQQKDYGGSSLQLLTGFMKPTGLSEPTLLHNLHRFSLTCKKQAINDKNKEETHKNTSQQTHDFDLDSLHFSQLFIQRKVASANISGSFSD